MGAQCGGLDSCTGKIAGMTPEPNTSKRKLLGKEAKKERWFSYYVFGYGIELNLDMLYANGIELISVKRAVLEDFRVITNVYRDFKPNQGLLNITPINSKYIIDDDVNEFNCVHGVLLELNRKNLVLLYELMEFYAQMRVSVQVYDEDGGEVCNEAVTFIYTNKKAKELQKNEDILFVPKIKKEGIVLSENYYKTIINGAKKVKISRNYINMLERYIKYKKYDPDPNDDHSFDKRLFTWKEIRESPHDINGNLAVLKGLVINYGNSKKYRGKDLTFKYAKMWYGANIYNTRNYETFTEEQREFIINMSYAHFEFPLNKHAPVIGLLKDDNDKQASWDYIEW